MDRDLLVVARNSIRDELGLDSEPIEVKDEWREKKGSFVTLTKWGDLRGCIGSLKGFRELYIDIMENAKSAAFRDPRFFPLQKDEVDKIKIEISLLSSMKQIEFSSKEELISKVEPFKMGLFLRHGYNSGTFLPQVWEHYPKTQDFLTHLNLKAGLNRDFYSDDMEIYYYTVDKVSEDDM